MVKTWGRLASIEPSIHGYDCGVSRAQRGMK
jgi:hypothetical protein